MAPHLLSLPAETRNLIYEYALTGEDGMLHYHENGDGIGRMFLKKDVIFRHLFGDRRYEDFAQDDTRVKSKFALLVPNQLQFVCQQLHYETSGLSIKYNTILFGASEYGFKTVKECAGFLRRIKPHQRDSVRVRIKYHGDEDSMVACLEQLFDFCETHPKSRIDMHFQHIEPVPHEYIKGANYLRTLFEQDVRSRLYNGMRDDEYVHSFGGMTYWKDNRREKRQIPSNFRFFPSMIKFDERFFRIFAAMQLALKGVNAEAGSPVDVDTFVAWAKDWWENGA